jgi:hypothetical protein
MTAGNAWYAAARNEFLDMPHDKVVERLASAAGKDGWHIEPEQHEEWLASVDLLQNHLSQAVTILRQSLADPTLAEFEAVILEYDMRRRGLRIDCVLLGRGAIAVLEFKRNAAQKADRDQVENYCVNLLEFHAETRRLCADEGFIIAPIVVQTVGRTPSRPPPRYGFLSAPWAAIVHPTMASSRVALSDSLRAVLGRRKTTQSADPSEWLRSKFFPSSTILDAALSLYGQHDVSAIGEHAAPIEHIRECTDDVFRWIRKSQRDGTSRVIFVSGAPGSGKTLLGLQVAFAPEFQQDTVFVTGNAPLVDVLDRALKESYVRGVRRRGLAGYPREAAKHVIRNATFKIVKAHKFLGESGAETGSVDGMVLIFDEAQRTYKKGKMVFRKPLADEQAALILQSMEKSYGKGCVVVALLGHNQVINTGEVGAGAWIRAAERHGWRCVVADDTATLLSQQDRSSLKATHLRETLETGHLRQSLRYYRNTRIEDWVAALLEGDAATARQISLTFHEEDKVWITRSLAEGRAWIRGRRVGEQRGGLVGSGNGGRLAAEGLFVGLKPNIADWMLKPDGDIRSSNMLETIQNQYQIQGLEIDWSLVCWDLDLRRSEDAWTAYKLNGPNWQSKSNSLDVALNGYRVLLTRARKGMAVFVPLGDSSGIDHTRPPAAYNAIADFLVACGATPMVSATVFP